MLSGGDFRVANTTIITGSTDTGFSATGMTAGNTTSFGKLDITVAGSGSAKAFFQDGGVLTMTGTTNLSVANNGTSTSTAFNTQNLSEITLGNVNIGIDANGNAAGVFANGINITGSQLSKAGDITINNIATDGTAINFNNVAMSKDNAIASVSIDGSQANGIVLSGGDFNVDGETKIIGSTVSSFSATDMTANNRTTFGGLTITQAEFVQDSNGDTHNAFFQDGGILQINGNTEISISGENIASDKDAFHTEGLISITLGSAGNTFIIGANNASGSKFANGMTVDRGTLLGAGAININNISGSGTAINFKNVEMSKDNAIASVNIDGSQANGIVLSGSDFRVANATTITGSTASSFSAIGMTSNNTTSIGGKFTIISTSNEPRPKNVFEQDGGNIILGDGLLLTFNYDNVTPNNMNMIAVNLMNTSLTSQDSIEIINNGKQIDSAINLTNSQINSNKNITISGAFNLGIVLTSNSSINAGTITIKNGPFTKGIFALDSKIEAKSIDITATKLMELYENASVTTEILTLNGAAYYSQEAFDHAKGQYADSITGPDLIHLP